MLRHHTQLKTNTFHLVSNKWPGETSFAVNNTMLYKGIIQGYLSLLWLKLATHFVTRAMPIDDIDGKSHKTELESSRNHSTNQSYKVKITPL